MMSAFFVNKSVIDDIVATFPWADPDAFGRTLWHLNLTAVAAAYPDKIDSHIDWLEQAQAYTFTRKAVSEAQRLKSLSCWLYQCAEGAIPDLPLYVALDDLETGWTQRLSAGKVDASGRPDVPGYAEAIWNRD